MIPLLLQLRIKPKEHRGFSIWLPFFLFWLIVLPLILAAGPFVLLAALMMSKDGRGKIVLNGYKAIFVVIFCMSGLKVDVQAKDAVIFFNLI